MPDFNLTNNGFVKNVPLFQHPIADTRWAEWFQEAQLGLDYGPKKETLISVGEIDWNPITYCFDGIGFDQPETNFSKGLFNDPSRTYAGSYGKYSNYYPYELNNSIDPWLGAGPRGDDWQPENLGVFTGNTNTEETFWKRGAYSMGVRCISYGMQNSLNRDRLTTYTFITPEFSYRPGKRELPTTGVGLSHRLVINFQVPWLELWGGKVGGYWGRNLHEAWPHRATGHPTFGVSLERENGSEQLVCRLVCPDDIEWATAQGPARLGKAINHNPADNLLNQYGKPLMRSDTGYVLQVQFREDRRTVAVKFNGEIIFGELELPQVIQDYFRDPPYQEVETLLGFNSANVGRGIGLSAGVRGMLHDYDPSYWTTSRLDSFGQPTMGLGFCMFDNLETPGDYHPTVAVDGDDRCHAVFGFHKATKNAKPFPEAWQNPENNPAPYYMNRPDGLNSAPPWMNLGSPWNRNINRAALWQRNNVR